jgi:hypothetical protein
VDQLVDAAQQNADEDIVEFFDFFMNQPNDSPRDYSTREDDMSIAEPQVDRLTNRSITKGKIFECVCAHSRACGSGCKFQGNCVLAVASQLAPSVDVLEQFQRENPQVRAKSHSEIARKWLLHQWAQIVQPLETELTELLPRLRAKYPRSRTWAVDATRPPKNSDIARQWVIEILGSKPNLGTITEPGDTTQPGDIVHLLVNEASYCRLVMPEVDASSPFMSMLFSSASSALSASPFVDSGWQEAGLTWAQVQSVKRWLVNNPAKPSDAVRVPDPANPNVTFRMKIDEIQRRLFKGPMNNHKLKYPVDYLRLQSNADFMERKRRYYRFISNIPHGT